MLTETTVYFITRLDDVKQVLQGVFIISGILSVASTIAILLLMSDTSMISRKDQEDSLYVIEEWKKLFKWWKSVRLFCIVFFAISLFAYPFVPTTKEMAAIKVIPAIVNSQDAQEIGQDFKVLAKEWLDELRPKKDFPSDKR
jgi:hypothetical protein